MGFRKFVVIPWLFLASVLMLAYTIFPHHHHDAYICFVSEHCEEHNDHAPHSHDKEHSCTQHLLQARTSKVQHLRHTCQKGHCTHFIRAFIYPEGQIEFLSSSNDRTNRQIIPYREKLHETWLLSSTVGRAPPAIG
ncbi:MAG: hypothetical protein K2O69_06580 [Odoribacter sp.]|nr:hypothetical protein [Odoribacter sp.]